MEETMRSTLSFPTQAWESMFHSQIQYIDIVVDIPECAEDGDSHCHVRFVCVYVPEARDELSSVD